MIVDLLDSYSGEIVHGSAKSNAGRDVWRASFIALIALLDLIIAIANILHHAPANQERLDLAFSLDPENASPLGRKHLVPGKAEKIASDILHVHRHVGHGLGCVHQQGQPRSRQILLISFMGRTVPSALESWLTATSRVPLAIAFS